MIHGKTKIELYNPNTKIKNIIKSENTFQSNVLADYFQALGEEDSNPFRTNSYDNKSLWKNALGGIFLFKNPETVGNKFMSAGNTMIGNGSYDLSNSGNPNELGSYNSQESSESASEITQVYDFATNQANGNIACVCLTSRVGGYIGYGNRSGQYHSARSYSLESLQNFRGVIDTNIALANGNWTILPSGDYSDGKIRITKIRRSLITGSVFNGYSKTLEFDLSEVGNGYNLSGTFSYGAEKIFDVGNGKFRWIPNQNDKTVAPNGTVYYYEFDAINDTLTQKSFINSSSNTITVVANGFTEVTHTYFLGKYAIVLIGHPTQGNGYIAEVFDTTTSEHIKTLNLRTIYGVSSGVALRRHYTYVLGDNLFAFSGSQSGVVYLYDIEAGTIFPINSSTALSYAWIHNPSLISGALAKEPTSYNSSGGIGYIHNPLYLATINNLDSYVTKTANQTMKVTYTLTEE